jgi:ABC-type sugar transport system substrate-binding protein
MTRERERLIVYRDKGRWRGTPRRTLAVVASVAALAAAVTAVGGASASGASAKHVSIATELVLTGVQFAQNASLGMKTAAADAGSTTITINGPTSINPVLAPIPFP